METHPYILIIEDSSSQALRLRLLLQQAGYQADIARDGEEGWQKAYQNHPTVILLDVNLPIVSGFELLSRLKQDQTTSSIPVVMLTSLDSINDVEEAVARGADGYLFKDDCLFRPEGVRQIVDTVHQLVPAQAEHENRTQPVILVVEDSASQAIRLQLLLQQAGYDHIQAARDGEQGWQMAQNIQPTVILLDINLPGIDGFDLLSRLKQDQTTSRIPVVMLTSLDRVQDVEEAVARGADGYLFKDDCLFKMDGAQQIVDTVDQVMHSRTLGGD